MARPTTSNTARKLESGARLALTGIIANTALAGIKIASGIIGNCYALIADGISQEALEDDIGWALNDFLESEAKALSEYGVEFLKALCERLGVGWTEALP